MNIVELLTLVFYILLFALSLTIGTSCPVTSLTPNQGFNYGQAMRRAYEDDDATTTDEDESEDETQSVDENDHK